MSKENYSDEKPKSKPYNDLFKNKTDDRINYDDVDFSTLDSANKKAYTDLFTGLLDIYKLVGASPDDTQEVINKKCASKKAQLHVDKRSKLLESVPPEKRASENRKLDKQYKLICDASKILRDPEKRKYYDLQKKTRDSKDFYKQKNSFKQFVELQDSEINDQTKQISSNNFKMGMLEFDKKHNFDRSALSEKPMNSEESSRRLEDLEWARREQEDEYQPKNLFEGKNLDSANFKTEFNKMWEKMNGNKNKSRNKNKDGSLVVWDGISASNDFGLSGSNNFVSVDSNYENIYDTNDFNSSEFASKLDSDSEDNSDIDFNDCSGIDVSYVNDHNKNKEDVMLKYAEFEKMRKQEDAQYEERSFGDKKIWGSVLENPMNISAQMGNIVGNDMKKLDGPKKKKHITRDEIEAYKQLIYDDNNSK